MWRRKHRRQRSTTSPEQTPLVYEVPTGQDPSILVEALRRAGIEAIEVVRQGRQRVVISGPRSSKQLRSRARAVIAHETHPLEVTFLDE